MDFFVVNRFSGEETHVSDKKMNEKEQIDHLFKSIKERKRRKLERRESTNASSKENDTIALHAEDRVSEKGPGHHGENPNGPENSEFLKTHNKRLEFTNDLVLPKTHQIEEEKMFVDDIGTSHRETESMEVKLSEGILDRDEKMHSSKKLKCKTRKLIRESQDPDKNHPVASHETRLSEELEKTAALLGKVFVSKHESQPVSSLKSSELMENEHPLNDSTNDRESPADFTVIGSYNIQNRAKTKYKLPSWIENPVIIPIELYRTDASFKTQGVRLDRRLMRKLKESGFEHFFPVQEKVIPWLLESNSRCFWPRDLCVSAPTGSGKTLAYVLPIVQMLMKRTIPSIRALVVLPVVELAEQIGGVFKYYCSGTNLKVTIAGGSNSFSKEHDLLVTKEELVGCQTDILVTTPGRLVAHLRARSSNISQFLPYALSPSSLEGKISFKNLRFLVMDEADKVGDGTQNDWLVVLTNHLECFKPSVAGLVAVSADILKKYGKPPLKPPQKLLFSATLSEDPEKLSKLCLFQPKLFTTRKRMDGVSTKKYATPIELKEEHVISRGGESDKPLVLLSLLKKRLLEDMNVKRILIFANSRCTSSRLALLMSYMTWGNVRVNAANLSADLSKRDRGKILQDFIEGRTNVLVSSDALARGVDVPEIDLVISYDPPKFMKNHIHRIGRTGRAGRQGCAITILTPKQFDPFSLMVSGESHMKHSKEISIEGESLVSMSDSYQMALAEMEETLLEEKEKKVKESKKKKRRGIEREGVLN